MTAKIITACLGIITHSSAPLILLSSRPEGKVLAGFWEFPGGKLESGEDCFTALARELKEELGIEVAIENMERIGQIEHQYPHGLAQLDLIIVKDFNGELQGLEGQSLQWCSMSMNDAPQPLLPTTERVFQILQQKDCLGR
jgi:8-oxo-dGTP diphosphatase